MTRTHRVTLKDFADKIAELDGKAINEIAEITGFSKNESARQALIKWKNKGKITYKLKNGQYFNFKLLDSVLVNEKANSERVALGRELKARLYYIQVKETMTIIENATATSKDKLKAIELQQKALRGISDELMAVFNQE